MPFLILSVLIQVAFVIHIVKTGRDTKWIWIVLMLPMAGAIAYLILEVLPDASNSKGGRQAQRKVQSVINPNRDLNQAAKELGMSDNVENNMRLAQECYKKGLYEESKTLYEKCLTGIHKDDPALMFGLAQACFELAEYQQVKNILDEVIQANPDYKNQDAHFLYARTLENLNDTDGAKHEYEVLHEYYAGPQASFYYGKFLKSQNETEKAKAVFEDIMAIVERSNNHYKSTHKAIIKQVKSELSQLS